MAIHTGVIIGLSTRGHIPGDDRCSFLTCFLEFIESFPPGWSSRRACGCRSYCFGPCCSCLWISHRPVTRENFVVWFNAEQLSLHLFLLHAPENPVHYYNYSSISEYIGMCFYKHHRRIGEGLIYEFQYRWGQLQFGSPMILFVSRWASDSLVMPTFIWLLPD